MRKLTLRSEHLSELSTDELHRVAGGAPVPGTVSDGSCVCTGIADLILPHCDVSDGSCVCVCGGQTS